MSNVPISDAIAELRTELQKAAARKPETGIGFDVEAIEVELQVVHSTTTNMGVEAGWSVLGFKFGAESGIERAETGVHKVTLKLKPQHTDASGKKSDVEINSEDLNQS